MNIYQHDTPHTLALLALFFFIFSLALPSMQITVYGPATAYGWQAALSSFMLGSLALLNSLEHGKLESPEFIILMISSLMNSLFIIIPVLLTKAMSHKWTVALCMACMFGILAALAAPMTIQNDQNHLLPGYFLWLFSYGLLLTSLLAKLIRDHKNLKTTI